MCLELENIKLNFVQNIAANAPATDGLPPNFADQMEGINFSAAFNNPSLMNLATQMMGNPAMQDTISQLRNLLSGMDNVNNMNGIFEMWVSMSYPNEPIAEIFLNQY